MSEADYERGRADARLDGFDDRHRANVARFKAIEAEQKSINGKLDSIIEMMSMVKGGLRLLLAIGAISAAIGAVVTGIFQHLSDHWK